MPEPSTVREMTDDLESYQSLSNASVVSLVLGVLSVLSFAHWFFSCLFPPLAILTGLLAIRRINAAPEVWAGKRLAQLGVGLAIGCLALSFASAQLTTVRTKSHSKIVATRFTEKLAAGDIEGAFWLTVPKEGRRQYMGKSIDALDTHLLEKYMSFRASAAPLGAALAAREATIEFDEIEETGQVEGLDYALVMFKIRSSGPEKHLLLVVAGGYSQLAHEGMWWVRDQRFDYEPGSYQAAQTSGHGHAH